MADLITVEVAYALAEQQTLLSLDVPVGTTAHRAIIMSGLLDKHPSIDLENQKIGIFSQIVPLCYVLKAKDRVEIYRPLLIDPKEVRRLRAKKQANS